MKISEVAEITGLEISTIRFYERKGLILPDREKGSTYRSYTDEDVNRLKAIILYRKMDLSIEMIKSIIPQKMTDYDSIQRGSDKAREHCQK